MIRSVRNRSVVEHNRRMWDRLARAGIPYTRPQGRPPRSRAALRRFLDPDGRLKGLRIQGAHVLTLAAGGGWDAVVFALLGAETSLVDISAVQLRTARDLAKQKRVSFRTLRGDMSDLSRFAATSFNVVWQCHSLLFVRDMHRVFREVGRVLTPGGTYVTSTMHPTTLRLYGRYSGGGWRPKLSYFDDRAMPYRGDADVTWEFGRIRVIAPTIEFGHRVETLVNGIAAAGMVVDGLWESSPGGPDPHAQPGSDDHLESLFPAFIQIRARKL
jgi:ubiquinone/menaquinone biosynthesis C-methylase UbiE